MFFHKGAILCETAEGDMATMKTDLSVALHTRVLGDVR